MVRIVNGVIISQLESETSNSNASNLSSDSMINLFGFQVSIWLLPVAVVGGYLLGGVPGGMISTAIVGVGYCASSDTSQRSQTTTARPRQRANIKGISDYPKPVKC